MASAGPRGPPCEGIKLSADVKPFVPKFAGHNATWPESSEVRGFHSSATTCYPCVQELPVPEQKLYTEDVAFGASAFPTQYLSSETTLHPYAYSPYTLESTQNICPVPGPHYDFNQPNCYRGFQMMKPQRDHMCPLPQNSRALFKKKTYDEQKFDSKKTDGALSSDKSVKGSHTMSTHAENTLKSDGYHKRTDRKSRTSEKTGSASKPEFEFSSLDFPELQGTENSERTEIQKKPKWGPLRSAAPADISLLREAGKTATALPEGEVVAKKTNLTEPIADNAAADPSPCTRDPKNVSMSSSEVLSLDPSCKEKFIAHPSKKPRAPQNGNPEQNEASRKNKKKKEKLKSNYEVATVQEPPRIEKNFKSNTKKSQLPVQLDLGGMLTALEKKQHSQNAKQSSKLVVFSVGAVPVLTKEATSGKKGHQLSQAKTPHNPLDSSAPLIKKGKQREVPKAKKPTSLKKIILKERQERKQQRLQENTASPASASDEVQDAESGGEDQSLEQADPSAAGVEQPASTAPAVENKSEEQPGAEIKKEAETCCPDPDSTCPPKIHSRRFRDYCSQMLSKEVDACVTDLLKELVRFQDRMYQKDPVKAKTKRRLVLGLREVLKHLKLKKLKCIIISPNCEKIQSKGGLDETLHTIIDCACEQNIPFVFALNRKALGRSLNKGVPVSVVGIFSYDGAQDQFHKMVELTMAARQAYKALLENMRQELAEESGSPAPSSPPVQSPSPEDPGPPAPAEKEEPHYIEIWRKHLEAYNQCTLGLEDSLEASTSQMMDLNL
ncbi:selenocysteine insertion sequence-binding protein 2 isoform X6 [Erinaceus europaeus]|uniref:Selenocysteine insertion sequence-binding protein 2 isoform X6 n=1 Tax=Erinaceus europaeus TaxID=9365 RepID=A0ABM3Y623_ERIEU|nr:selenocysteine insertion sequence-binding protein 2 isoform X6 [Erinaceus europaeus]